MIQPLGTLIDCLYFHSEMVMKFFSYYMPLVEIQGFNALIDNKPLFDLPAKNKQAYGKLIKMSRNNDYTTGNYWISCIIKNIIISLV